MPDQEQSWELTFLQKPWLLNSERSGGNRGIGGYRGRADLTREWRKVFWALALEQHIPAMDQIHVTVIHTTKRAAGKAGPDIGNCFPAVKAAIDGLVDAGVIPDDCPPYIKSLIFVSPFKTGIDSLTLRVDRA